MPNLDLSLTFGVSFPLRVLPETVQHFRDAIFDARRTEVAQHQCKRKGFGDGPVLDLSWSRAAENMRF